MNKDSVGDAIQAKLFQILKDDVQMLHSIRYQIWKTQQRPQDHNKLWKILKKMGIPDHLTCLLRNLYVSQEATVRTGHGTTDWFQIGKGVH